MKSFFKSWHQRSGFDVIILFLGYSWLHIVDLSHRVTKDWPSSISINKYRHRCCKLIRSISSLSGSKSVRSLFCVRGRILNSIMRFCESSKHNYIFRGLRIEGGANEIMYSLILLTTLKCDACFTVRRAYKYRQRRREDYSLPLICEPASNMLHLLLLFLLLLLLPLLLGSSTVRLAVKPGGCCKHPADNRGINTVVKEREKEND